MTNQYLNKESLDALVKDRVILRTLKSIAENYDFSLKKKQDDELACEFVKVVNPQYLNEYMMIYENMKGD